LVSADSMTDAIGEATLTLKSAHHADTGSISVSCLGVAAYTCVEYASATAPTVRILTPTENQGEVMRWLTF